MSLHSDFVLRLQKAVLHLQNRLSPVAAVSERTVRDVLTQPVASHALQPVASYTAPVASQAMQYAELPLSHLSSIADGRE